MGSTVRMVTESGIARLDADPSEVAKRDNRRFYDGMTAEYAMRALSSGHRLFVDDVEYELDELRLVAVAR
jgi:hypothetical protein